MHICCGTFACAHCADDSCCSGNDVSPGPYTPFSCPSAFRIGNCSAVRSSFETVSINEDERVGTGAERHDNGIYFHLELRACNGYRLAPAACVRLAELHADTAHSNCLT